jgi:hypothetical protein
MASKFDILAYVANCYFTVANDPSRSEGKLGGAAAVAEGAGEEKGVSRSVIPDCHRSRVFPRSTL